MKNLWRPLPPFASPRMTRRALVLGASATAMLALPPPAGAAVQIDITQGNIQPLPIAIPDFLGGAPAEDDVVETVAATLEYQRVRRCMDGLTGLQRESIKLAYYSGYSYPQVAQLLGVALGTVKTRIRDGLIRMRDCMEVTW